MRNSTVSRFAAGLLLTAALVACIHVAARADETQAPSPEMQRLNVIIGSWEGDATAMMNGKTVHFRLHHENVPIVQGFGIQCRETADSPDIGHYESQNLLGFDPGRAEIHLLSVTNWAETHDHKGKWIDDKSFTLRYEGVVNGKPMVEVIPVTIVSNNEYRFKSTVTIDGKVDSTFEADMIRQDQAKR